ncbi:MAG: AAA family ATPase [Methylococcales bacterium]|nr:AAA family ATPase [Methylococcales bacterium]
MKLKNLTIKNFRCFDSLSIDLDEQLTVLVAKNGQGKSSVLDAIRIGLWSFVSGFDLARNSVNDQSNNIRVDDAQLIKRDGQMIRQLPCEVTLQGDYNINLIGYEKYCKTWAWTRFRESEAKGTKTKDNYASKLIKILANIAQDQIRKLDSPVIDLPLLGYYGTGRLWSQKRLTEDKRSKGGKHDADFFMRLFAYRDCLDPASSYKHFADWFTWVFESYREQQIKQLEKGVKFDDESIWKNTIQVVQQAIDSFLLGTTGWHSLEYSASNENSLILNHDEYGVLKVELLSDGIRSILAMVGDIAYRCIKLNPHLGLNAAKESSGVVLIDEIDMHLHPAWQQTVLSDLIKAFPKIQFIITTHSPQVISTVPSHQIRILDGNQVYSAEEGTQGAESSRILKEVFGVESRAQNLEIVQKLSRYLALIDADEWDTKEALALRQTLNEWSHGHEPELIKADIDIRMKDFQRQL